MNDVELIVKIKNGNKTASLVLPKPTKKALQQATIYLYNKALSQKQEQRVYS